MIFTMMRKRWLIIGISVGLLILVILAVGNGRIFYTDGPYHGKVIDKETKQSIEGAAVLAVWRKETPMIAHLMITYYDAQEILTDAEGNFTVPGIVGVSLNPLAKIREPLFTIFKPGYAAYGGMVFKPRSVQETVQRFEEDDRNVFALGGLTTQEERLKNVRIIYPGPSVPEEKYQNLIRLKNIERVSLGLKPTHIRKGKRNE